MTAPDQAPPPMLPAVAVFRASLVKLEADPRLLPWPEARRVLREAVEAFDELVAADDPDQVARVVSRLEALERRMATVIRLEGPDCDS